MRSLHLSSVLCSLLPVETSFYYTSFLFFSFLFFSFLFFSFLFFSFLFFSLLFLTFLFFSFKLSIAIYFLNFFCPLYPSPRPYPCHCTFLHSAPVSVTLSAFTYLLFSVCHSHFLHLCLILCMSLSLPASLYYSLYVTLSSFISLLFSIYNDHSLP